MDPKPDFGEIIRLLGPPELQKFCLELPGLSYEDVKKAEYNANSNDPELRAREVLQLWHQRNGQQATRQAVLRTLRRCGYIKALTQLRKQWNLAGINSYLNSFGHNSDCLVLTLKY